MSREPHMVAIRLWVLTVLQSLDADYTVSYSHADAPHPPRPYAIIQGLSDRRTSYPDVEVTDTAGVVDPAKVQRHTTSDRLITFSVSIYGDDARAHARQLELSLGDDAVDAIFDAGGVQVRHVVGSTDDGHALRSARWDDFVAVDFEAGFVATRTDEVAWIHEANITSTAGDLAGFDLTVEGP